MQINLDNFRCRLTGGITFVVLLALFCLTGLLGIQAHTDPTEMDTVAYLAAAVDIQETGGVLNHIPNCIRGVYQEATQHPLYLLMLAPFSEKSLAFFVQAKWITFGISIVLFLCFYFIARRYFGWKVACVAGLLMVLNATVTRLSTMVACETLLALCFLLFLYFLTKGMQDRKYWWVAGLFAGLTFLTKSLGILTLPIFICSVVWSGRKQLKTIILSKHFWAFFGVFILVASPLFLRNMKVYGSVLYSDSSAVLWVDDWHDYSAERAKSGEIGLDTYLRTHSIGEIVQILWRGLSDRNIRMMSDGLKPIPFWTKIDPLSLQGFHQKTFSHQGTWAFILFIFAGIGLWANRKQAFTTPAVFSFMGFYVFVGWFSKIFETTPPTRLIYCILFLVLMYSAAGMVFLSDKLKSKLFSGQYRWISKSVFYFVLVVAGLNLVFNHSWKGIDFNKTYRINPIFATQLNWVIQSVPADQKVWVGDSFASYEFYFEKAIQNRAVPIPKLDRPEALKDSALSSNVQFMILDLATVVHNYNVFKPYYVIHPQMGLVQRSPLPLPFKALSMNPGLNRFYHLFQIIH